MLVDSDGFLTHIPRCRAEFNQKENIFSTIIGEQIIENSVLDAHLRRPTGPVRAAKTTVFFLESAPNRGHMLIDLDGFLTHMLIDSDGFFKKLHSSAH